MRIITLIAAVTAWAAAAWAEPTAQIRKQTVHIDVISQSEYRMTEHTEVVIYKETMSQLANFYTTLDKSEKIERFACVVEGVNSKFNKKYKAGDLKYSEYSGDMVTDLKSVELSIDLPLYPIVVTTDVTYHRTDNTISYPPFLPIPAYDTEVKEATYMIDFPASMNLRYVAMDTDMKPVESTTPKGKKRWTFTLANQGEIVYEEFSKPLLRQIPKVLFVPERLDYYGTQGSMKSWEEFGLWINSLCQGMDVLPDDARAKVHELTDTCATDWDKVRVLYNLLRRHTRYVSIQTYTLISTKYDRLIDLPNFQQLNHVILKVPTSKGVIWMECTNPEIPLGYTHNDIAGHEAVEISDKGGHRVILPDYADTLNLRTTKVKTVFRPDGTGSINIIDSYSCHRYTRLYGWLKKSEKDRINAAARAYSLPFGNIKRAVARMGYRKGEGGRGLLPLISASVEADQVQIATSTRARLFATVNPLHSNFVPSHIARDRKHEIYIDQGFKNVEIIEMTLPEGCMLEATPKPVSISNEIGSFTSTVSVEGRTVKQTNTLILRRGTYPAAKAQLLDDLDSAADTVYKGKVILKRP